MAASIEEVLPSNPEECPMYLTILCLAILFLYVLIAEVLYLVEPRTPCWELELLIHLEPRDCMEVRKQVEGESAASKSRRPAAQQVVPKRV